MYIVKRKRYCSIEGGARGARGLGGARSGGAYNSVDEANAGPGGAGDSPLDVAGAIMSRDGIVGAWSNDLRIPPGAATRTASVDNADCLEDWEPWVRGTVIDVDLLEPLSFKCKADSKSGFQVCLRNEHSGGDPLPWVTLSRPDEDPEKFGRQVELVFEYAELREDRQAEILSQVPQLVTYWTAVAGLHPTRHRWTLELMAAAVRFAIAVEVRFKHALAFPRPVQFSPQIQPMIQTPGHSSFPSGHSTEAYCTAQVLIGLMGVSESSVTGTMLLRQAARIATNRTVAGVHFPVDSRAGQILGTSLAEYIARRGAGSELLIREREFDADQAIGKDFVSPDSLVVEDGAPGVSVPGEVTTYDSDLIKWLWSKASDEWLPAKPAGGARARP